MIVLSGVEVLATALSSMATLGISITPNAWKKQVWGEPKTVSRMNRK